MSRRANGRILVIRVAVARIMFRVDSEREATAVKVS